MATVNKDFKIKNGLVVEGSTATVNGHDILTDGIVDAKGDILVASGADAVVRLAVGSDNYILTADSNATNGVAWKAPQAVGEFGSSIVFEGSTADGNETTIAVTDPTADRTITFPDADGTVALTSDIIASDSANTVDTLVLRDGSGNFAAGTVTVNRVNIGGVGYIEDDGSIEIVNTDGDDINIIADDIRLRATDDVLITSGDQGSAVGDIALTTNGGNIRFQSADVYLGTNIGFTDAERVATQGYVDQAELDAVSTANSDTDTKLEDYTPTSSLDATVDGYGYLKSADLSGYATESYVGTAIDNLVDGAPGLLDTLNEIAAAIADDENYATTMTTALSGKQNNLTAGDNISIVDDVIDVTGLDSTDISDFATAAQSAGTGYFDPAGSADTAESDANAYTDTALESYTTTANLESTIDFYGFAYTSEIPTSTDELSEGATNEYFTDARAKASAAALLTNATLDNITITGDANGLTITAENGVADSTTDDLTEGSTSLYFTDERALDAVGGSNIQPLSIDINTYRKEEATQQVVASASTVTAHTFTGNRSVKYLVRTVGTVSGTVHSQVTELLVTVDGGNNVAVTEYGTIYTSENPLATATMDYDGVNEEYRLRVTTAITGAEVVVAATILTWD